MKGVQLLNDSEAPTLLNMNNRTGAAIGTLGSVYIRDLRQDDAASDTVAKGLHSIVAANTSNKMMPACVIDPAPAESVADDGPISMVTAGPCKCKLNGAVNKGDYVEAVAAQTYMEACTTSSTYAHGISLTTSTGGAVTGDIWLFPFPDRIA